MKKIILILFIIFLSLVSFAYADDGLNVCQLTGTASTNNMANAFKLNDGSLATQASNTATSPWSGACVLPSTTNMFISNLTIYMRSDSASETWNFICVNATSGANIQFDSQTVNVGDFVYTYNNFNKGCSAINISQAGAKDGGIYEINATNGTNTTAPISLVINNTKPIINITYPNNGDTLDNVTFPFYINGTVVIQNGTILNITINNTNFRNIKNQTNFTFEFNGTFTQGLYSLSFNATSNYGNSTYLNFTVIFDVNKPNSVSTLENNKSLFYLGALMNFQINYSDNIKFYSFNISADQNLTYQANNINTTLYIYNATINVSNFTIGKHNITTSFCDAHTKNRIENWEIVKLLPEKELKFNFGSKYFSVRPLDNNLVSTFDADKQEDRYTFRYFKNNKNNKQFSFIVSSTEKIEIIGNDKGYYGWLVIPTLQKWIDFNTNDGTNLDYKITRIDNKNVQIDINGIDRDIFVFHSAGDLNCNSKVYEYYIFNYTAIFSNSVIETTKDLINLQIDFKDIVLKGNGTLNYYAVDYNTSNYTSINQLNLTLNFTIPQVINNETNVTLYWNFNLNGSSFTTVNYTQLINRIRLATCGADTDVRTLNISIFNEQNPIQPLKTQIAALFTTWTNDSTITLNFTFNFVDASNYSICIFPNTSVSTNAYIQYNVTGGYAERWFLTNARLSTNTSILYLFNFNSQTGISLLNGALRDKTYSFFPNIITKLQRRYLSEGIWRTVQMDKSDDFGQIALHVIEQSQDYRLIFEKDGTQIDQTDSMKFICTNAICSLSFIVKQSAAGSGAKPLFSPAYDNSTQMFQLNFSDTTGLTSSVRLLVAKETGLASNTICDTTLATSSGTINCNTTGYDGSLVFRVYSSASPETPKLFGYITKAVNRLFQKLRPQGYEKDGILFATGISITLTIAGMIFNPVAGIILYILSLIGINFMGLANFVTNTFISIVAVLGVVVSLLLRKRQ